MWFSVFTLSAFLFSVWKVNYENSNVLSSAKRSVRSETSYEAVISDWLNGLKHFSGLVGVPVDH
jgi:hypothetical protein